ncbi:hypothetical protein AG1IA_09077 [Rhizoctonia solani AG-1 IA]|uniref:Fungal-type protein kinase domain-containing protein n=1 Tax=Thanatephorus cucumeris (strain AG1-IA) TaxID=983506 RepID=L8WJJ3_THACA|nr:hypothetical protein AG1IA_09077 [Rhizoctonia solani AG-1 IA]
MTRIKTLLERDVNAVVNQLSMCSSMLALVAKSPLSKNDVAYSSQGISTPMSSFSSPVKPGQPPPESPTASQNVDAARSLKITCEIDSNSFMKTYIGYTPKVNLKWSLGQRLLISKIQQSPLGAEASLCIGATLLLLLLNSISLQVVDAITMDAKAPALVFRASHNEQILNPITTINPSSSESPVTWCGVVADGDIEAKKDTRYQPPNHLLSHSQLHPELSAVLGFATRSGGYNFVYHELALRTSLLRSPPPEAMEAQECGCTLDSNGKEIRASALESGPGGKPVVERYKMRVLTPDVGRPLGEVRSLDQFLRVMYDACVDISDNNVMIAPDDPEFYERCAEGYNRVKYINQVLSGNEELCVPSLKCRVFYNKFEQGTPKFMARSVSRGEPLAFRKHRGELSQMPKLQGRALEVYQLVHGMQYEEFNQSLDKSCCPTSDPGIKFTHQLFHDAESTFWIIAWNLARSVGPNYQPEKEWTSELSTFISALGSHYPSRDLPDPRIALDPSLKCWSRILHSDLANIASMLSQMHEYIEPEWAYRNGLSAEHAHEALMRLLLTEIIRIEDHPESDLPLFIGARSLPVKLVHHSSSQKSKTSSFLSLP